MELNEVFLRRAIELTDVKVSPIGVSLCLLYLEGESDETMYELLLLGVEYLQLEISTFNEYTSLDVDDKTLEVSNGLQKLRIINPALEFECHYRTAELKQLT